MSTEVDIEFYLAPREARGFYQRFAQNMPLFASNDFHDFLADHNLADRDSGELDQIAAHEVLRCASEWILSRGSNAS